MSTIVISYGDLKDAESDAKKVAKKIDNYRDEINDKVYNKLSKYDGDQTENISSAFTGLSTKMSSLKDTKKKFKEYAERLEDVRTECKETDKAVKKKVYSLTGQFKDNYDIVNDPILNGLNYILSCIGDSNCVFRYLKDGIGDFLNWGRNLQSRIKEWYSYEGGKEFISGVAVALCEIVLAVAAVVAAIGGSIVLLVAAVIAAVIAVANGICNIVYECKALDKRGDADFTSAKKLSDTNKVSDEWRANGWDVAANILDTVEFVANVVGFVGDLGDLVKNGYAWASKSAVNFEKLDTWKDIYLSGKTYKSIGSKALSTLKDGFKSIDLKDWSKTGKFFKSAGEDFLKNLKKSYTNFENVESVFETMGNWADAIKPFAEDPFELKGIDGTLKEVITSNISVAEFKTYSTNKDNKKIINFNADESISLSDILGIGDIADIAVDSVDLVKNWSADASGNDLMDGLTVNTDVKVPDIQIPSINVPQFS